MILDELIGSIVAIFMAILYGPMIAMVVIANACALMIELVVGLFVPDFKMPRLAKPKLRGDSAAEENVDPRAQARRERFWLVLILFLLVTGGASLLWPYVTEREVQLVAEDGHALPLAAMVLHAGDGAQQLRTDLRGNLTIPRFGWKTLTVRDLRYVEKTWTRSDVTSQLVVKRSLAGSALDRFTDSLIYKGSGKNG